MTPENELLDNILSQSTAKTLWCVDENIGEFAPTQFNGKILCNRFDIHQRLVKQFPLSFFNDFDFSAIETNATDSVVFRIAKEKAINHHIVEQAVQRLSNGMKLILLGYKNEGIISLTKRISATYQCEVTINKCKAQLQHIEIAISHPQSLKLNEFNYQDLQKLCLNNNEFYSKPGIFGWNKIDRGSELLIEALTLQSMTKTKNVLDLGCGYGFLSIRAHSLGFTSIDATDNNAAAIICCQKNFQTLGIMGNVFADNHASQCTKKYDIVLCNPPFHQGFDHTKNLTEIFVQQAFNLLKSPGKAYFVTNQFIGIEKLASQIFKKCDLLFKKDGFKGFVFEKN